jgi:predicted ribosome quality control (RQC) complex YloA/Tae2 family protein
MDNFVLRWIALELDETLRQERLGKTYQLGTTDLALDLRLRDGRWLFISTSPRQPGIFLSTRQPRELGAEPRSDTPFVSLLRKHLNGGRLTRIEKVGYDRVLYLTFLASDDSGEKRERRLVVSLIGRAADVLIIEESRILASLRRQDDVSPDYEPPEPPITKLDPYQCTPEKLDEIISNKNGDIEAAAHQYLIGFTPVYARELAERSRTEPKFSVLKGILEELTEGPPTPSIYSPVALTDLQAEPGRDDFEIVLSPIRLTHLSGWKTSSFATMNEAADAFNQVLTERLAFLARRQEIVSRLKARLKRQRGLAANLSRELQSFSNADELQRFGQLLLANLHQATKRGDVFVVADFYDEAMALVEIPARDQSSPREAADLYFKLARKARHGNELINQRLPGVVAEIGQLEEETAIASTATRAGQLVRHEPVRRPGSTEAAPKQSPRRKPEPIKGVRRYRSSDGYEILVGRADRDNDALTFRVAKSFDLWFHAADYPGSHVVLRNPTRKEVPPRAITEAAQLAAQFSQARTESKAAVNYCERKFVSKPKGFAPGQVRVSSFKTILVQPRESGERILSD